MIADSCYGQHLASMIQILKGIVRESVDLQKTVVIHQVPGFPSKEDKKLYRDLVWESMEINGEL